MPVDYIRYDILTQEALRGVVRTVLVDAAKNGLPGDHHFYISIDTHAEGVRLSPRLAAQYPQEITVVLQHQFWDLIVTEEGFEVGLSFNGVPERLTAPFTAIRGFYDPSVQFGLQFEVIAAKSEEASQGASPPTAISTPATGPKLGAVPRIPAQHDSSLPAPAEPLPTSANPASASPKDEPDKPSSGGEVVRLDRFRKK
jgi:hypothetical protein